MPIKNRNKYDEFYLPLVEKTLELLTTGEYLPTKDGQFVSPENAVLTYADDLTKLLSSQQLTKLLEKTTPQYWIIREITRDKNIELRDYIKNQLNIFEMRGEDLVKYIDKEFLSTQNDEWLNEFYKYLSNHKNIAKQLKTIPIIRCEDGKMRAVCKLDGEALVFLPTDDISEFPIIKHSIYEYGNNQAFFKSLGIEKPDINDEITRILNRYREENKLSVADNQKHIQHIIAVWDKLDKETQQKVRKTPLLLAQDISGCLKGYQAPKNVYFPSDELKTYFGVYDDTKICFLAIENYSIQENDFLKIGVKNIPALVPVKRSFYDFKYGELKSKLNPKPEKMHANEPYWFDNLDLECKSEFNIYGLEKFLYYAKKIEDIKVFWKLVIECNNVLNDNNKFKCDLFKGHIRWFYGNGNYYSGTDCYYPSKVFETLEQTPCIPNQDNELSCPQNISYVDIAEWFIKDFIEPNEKIFALFDIKNDDDGFPTETVNNPEIVKRKAKERIDETPFIYEEQVTRIEIRNRADKNTVRTILKNEYSNYNKNLFCQMCEQEMPTLSQNSEEYLFYASPLFRETKKDDWTNYICLCPTCRTKYDNHIATRNDLCSQIKQEIEKELELKRNPKIEISLPFSDEKIKIRFTQNHFFQLKTVFDELGVDEDKKKIMVIPAPVMYPKNILSVKFPDGTVICESKAVQTFLKSLQKIGLQKVRELNIRYNNWNIIETQKSPTLKGNRQHECDGYWVYTNTEKWEKQQQLQEISQRLNLGLLIELN